jgi:hypothetical protein
MRVFTGSKKICLGGKRERLKGQESGKSKVMPP